MGKSEKELHKQVEQQRISLKKLIDKHTRNTEKVQNSKTRKLTQKSFINLITRVEIIINLKIT